MFSLVAMLSIRTGWPRGEVRQLTLSEVRLTLEELGKVDEQSEARAIEAHHRPNAPYERAKNKQKANGMDGWKKLLSMADPERLKDFELKEAAMKFVAEKNKRG